MEEVTRREIDLDAQDDWLIPDSLGVAVYREHDDGGPAIVVLELVTAPYSAGANPTEYQTLRIVLDTERAAGLIAQLHFALGKAHVPQDLIASYIVTGMGKLKAAAEQ